MRIVIGLGLIASAVFIAIYTAYIFFKDFNKMDDEVK